MKHGFVVSLLIVATFLVVLFSHVWIYPLFNLVILGLLLLFLKRHEWKTVATILSPVLAAPFAIYFLDVFGRMLPIRGSNVWLYGFSILAILTYAYLFRELFTRWIEPKNLKPLLYLILVLFIASFIASLTAIYCLDVSSSEKGVSLVDIRTCQMVGAYLPSVSGKTFVRPWVLQIVSFIPSTFVLLLALVQRFAKQQKQT